MTGNSAGDQTVVRYSLSSRLLVFVFLFVTLGGVLIHVPSVIRFWHDYLEHRVIDTYMTTLVLHADPSRLNRELEKLLLEQTQVLGIVVEYPHPTDAALRLGSIEGSALDIDLRAQTAMDRTRRALSTLLFGGDRRIRVHENVSRDPKIAVSILMNERPLQQALLTFTQEVLAISVLISLFTATLVYMVLRWLIVRPVYRITHHLMAFREAPEDPGRIIQPGSRHDEIGVMEQELARMQVALRAALAQQSRLAALGTAVSKINHDLKSTLSTVSIASERLSRVDDPTVRKIAPLLVDAVERAVYLCTQTQDLARGDQALPRRVRFPLRELVDEVSRDLQSDRSEHLRWIVEIPETLAITADRERLYRVLGNLIRNSVEALDNRPGGEIRINAARKAEAVVIDLRDNGPGIPEPVRAHLFQPFVGTARPGGTGLGLATARDLVRAHGGELVLLATGPEGTCFRITLPSPLSENENHHQAPVVNA